MLNLDEVRDAGEVRGRRDCRCGARRFFNAPGGPVRELRDTCALTQALIYLVVTGPWSCIVIRHAIGVLRIQSELTKLALASDILGQQLVV